MVVSDAYAECERIARLHYENFPVASILLPRAMRPHVAAVYAFARAADDFADEGQREDSERMSLLDGWGRRLRRAAGFSTELSVQAGEPEGTEAIFTALGETIRARSLPLDLFEDLLSAFRQDVTVRRYLTWDHLMDYCRRSANPVGRLVLRIAGVDDPRIDRHADSLCSALQLTNFWQDVLTDFDRGRIYLPADDYLKHGATEPELAAGITPAWQRALASAAARTRVLYDEGRAVCDDVEGRLRYELRATWLGGMRILDRLETSRFDLRNRRPSLGARDVLWIAARALVWSSSAAL